jgi:hypothetical protein
MKKDTKAECSTTARLARHSIAKSPLDISELNIHCLNGGYIELSGVLRIPRGHIGELNMKKEFDALKNMIRTSRGVKEVNGDRVKMF